MFYNLKRVIFVVVKGFVELCTIVVATKISLYKRGFLFAKVICILVCNEK